MSAQKEQNTASVPSLKEMEIYELPDTEFQKSS